MKTMLNCYLYHIPQEILECIFILMSSKTRSEICSVDRKFHKMSLRISMQLSKYSSTYITRKITTQMDVDINPIIISSLD